MLFSSLVFLLIFLPITLFVYFSISGRMARNIILLVASLIFYGWAEPKLLVLMLLLLFINYVLTIIMDRYDGKKRLYFFIFILIINLVVLFYYKYFNFTLYNLNCLFHTSFDKSVILPIGISFYLFQMLSYVIDVYQRKVNVQRSFLLLSTYIALFPQLVAGPIVRYETIEEQLQNRVESWEKFYIGLQRFIIGLSKKIIISNNIAIISDLVFCDTQLSEINFLLAWIGAIAYTLQIYFDFSGYSDMAIGLGKMFGFDFLENFNYPYLAESITDFWRRWHISLSTWFRDYVYIPLGGNRQGKKRQLINIMIVWALTGLWHGAAWNFIFWGVYFAIILIVEKIFFLDILEKLPKLCRHIYALFAIVIGWVIFYSTSLTQIIVLLKNMFDLTSLMSFTDLKNLRIIYLWPYLLVALFASTPIFKNVKEKLEKSRLSFIIDIILALLLGWCILLLVNDSYNPFIYYRF